MEILAALSGLQEVKRRIGSAFAHISIYSDSKYLVDGASQWIWGWQKRNWITSTGEPVKNADLWKTLLSVLEENRTQWKLSWKYIEAHSGLEANERCDQIAVECSKGGRPTLYCGSLASYSVDWKTRETDGRSAKPYYLSLIGGAVHRDETWPQCQARVQASRGAKYKKVRSKTEEDFVLKQWGFIKSPSQT